MDGCLPLKTHRRHRVPSGDVAKGGILWGQEAQDAAGA